MFIQSKKEKIMKNKKMTFGEIDELALKIAKSLENGGVLGLIGDLGTGKTTLTKKICKYYNVTENVKSPTFTYVIEYISGDKTIYHFDVYRILNSEEVYEIGFSDYVSEVDAIVIVEWANNIIDEMPENTLFLEITHNDENTRLVSIYKIENGERKYVDIWDNDFN